MPSRRPALLALVLATALACNDATAPDESVRVTATATLEGEPEIVVSGGAPFMECLVRVDAAVTGGSEGEWTGGTLRWYAGLTRTTPFDTVILTVAEVRGGWTQGPTIVPGLFRTSYWQLGASVPFFGDIAFRYRGTGGDTTEHTVTVPFRCGPALPPNAPPPVIADIVLPEPATTLRAGSTFNVNVAASAGALLWRSAVLVTGPCQLVIEYTEELRGSMSRTVPFLIEPACADRGPITVRVAVMDAAGRVVEKTLVTDRVVVSTPVASR